MMNGKCIWYISKYVVPPDESTIGGRGYMLLRELANSGYKCLIFASDASEYSSVPDIRTCYHEEIIEGLSFWWVRTFKYAGAKSFKRILSWLHFEWRLFRMPKAALPVPDAVIISSLSILTIFNGFLLRKKFGCKLIFEIRDIWPLTLTEEGGFKHFNPFIVGLSVVEKLGYKYSDVVVGTMPNLGEHVAEVLGYEREVSCVPMGLDVDRVHDVLCLPADYKKNYFPDEKFLVVHAGSIGITNALEAFLLCAESLSNIPEIQFLIVGDGYLKAEYQERYSHLANLIFAPKVPRKMVQSVLKECDLLYFSVPESEVWKYGQSLNKVIDYMLSGKPIVASYTGYESMINEAQSGSFVPAGDVASLRKEIIRYFEMPKVNRDQIGLRGKEWVLSNRDYKSLAASYARLLFPTSVNHSED